MTTPVPATTRLVALVILAVGVATIAGALASQHLFGLVPCKLCLWQRWPYYAGLPLAALTAASPHAGRRRIGLALLALLFAASFGLGGYHAGVEWGWWPGPTDCGGGSGTAPAGVGGLLESLESVRVVSCEDAAWRFLGLSLAGWNALVSLALAGLAGRGAAQPVSVSPNSSSRAAQERASASAE